MQNINILNKVTNDINAKVDTILGNAVPTLEIYDTIESKTHTFKIKVVKKDVKGSSEVADVPIQYKLSESKESPLAVCDNTIVRGKIIELIIVETETLGVLETIGGVVDFGKKTVDAGKGTSAVSNLKAILEKATLNSLYLKYEGYKEMFDNLIITNISYPETAIDNNKQVEIKLSLKQVLNFQIDNAFPNKTSSIKPVSSASIEGLSDIVNKTKTKSLSAVGLRQAKSQANLRNVYAKSFASAEKLEFEPEILEIELSLNFGDFYNFETNFYLGKLFLNFSFKYLDAENKYEISIFNENILIFQGIARFFETFPSIFGYDPKAGATLKPRGSFIFLPVQPERPKSLANIKKEDFIQLNFRLFFIETL